MNEHRSVAGTDVHARAVGLNQASSANEIAEQGAVANVGLVWGEAWISIAIASSDLWPIFRISRANILNTVHQQSLCKGRLLAILGVGHFLQPHRLLAADVSSIQEGEVEARKVHGIAAGKFCCLARRIVVWLLADAVGIPETGVARLGLTLNEVDRVSGVREVAHGLVIWESAGKGVITHGHATGTAVLAPVAATPSRELGRVQVGKDNAVLTVVRKSFDALVVGNHIWVRAGLIRNALPVPWAAKRP